MVILLVILALGLGIAFPRLVGNRETTTWTIWFLRRLFPALCYGTAIGLLVAHFAKR